MKKIKVDEFEKKGHTIEVLVQMKDIDEYVLFLKANGQEVYTYVSSQQGIYGYRVSEDGFKRLFPDVKLKGKGSVLLTNDNAPKVREKAEELLKEYREEKLQEARERLTDETEIKLVLSTSYSFITVKDIEYADELDEFKEGVKLFEQIMDIDEIESILGRKHNEFEYGDYSITHKFYMTYGEFKKLIEAAKQKKAEIEKKRQEEVEKKQKEIDEKFKQARETGEKVELERWHEDCNDPSEECNLDIVVIYAMPDGSTKTERVHTY